MYSKNKRILKIIFSLIICFSAILFCNTFLHPQLAYALTFNKKDELISLRDKIKTDYAKDKNIDLVRIPYWESKNVETIIDDCLQRLNEKGFVENLQSM